MAKSIGREVAKNNESWVNESWVKNPRAGIEQTFPAGKGQVDDHAPYGGYLQQRREGGEK
jgi:hypothetical protein